jgi:hypothetical protein
MLTLSGANVAKKKPEDCTHMRVRVLASDSKDVQVVVGCADCLTPLSRIKPGTRGLLR